jgi:hypothetical protein
MRAAPTRSHGLGNRARRESRVGPVGRVAPGGLGTVGRWPPGDRRQETRGGFFRRGLPRRGSVDGSGRGAASGTALAAD